MNETRVPPTTLSTDGAARLDERPRGSGALPPRPASPSSWTAGRVTSLVIGALLTFVSLILLGSGGTALWVDLAKRDAGYLTTDAREFSTSGSALVTVPTELGSARFGWLYSPGLLDEIRIRVTPSGTASPLFVGIGRTSDVDRYLAGVHHTVISEFFREQAVRTVDGQTAASAPGAQDFWVASDTGPGPRTLHWDPTDGWWTVVVMNADGRPGIDAVRTDLGATVPALVWIASGVLAGGVVFLVGGVLLLSNAIRRWPKGGVSHEVA